MSALTATYAILFYVATAILAGGVLRKIVIYTRTPAPFKIPVAPAPLTRTGVVWRILKEVTIFESLYKSNKWIWVFGWIFHVALLLILVRHLRYFTEPVWTLVALAQPFGKYAAFGILVGLGGLWARRILVDRIRYISSLSDHLMLLLLIAIAASGMMMRFGLFDIAPPAATDIIAVKAFFLSLLYFDIFHIQPLPEDLILLVHLTLVVTLMIIFPVSKLLHAPGVFFSPTRNQVDDARKHRHVAGWTAADAPDKP
jgi:[DsrC]-trisulfide reductase subunit M